MVPRSEDKAKWNLLDNPSLLSVDCDPISLGHHLPISFVRLESLHNAL